MVKKCAACGFNNRDDALYCSNCGTALGPPAAPPPAPPGLKPVPAVRVVTPVTPAAPVRVPPLGMCAYHPNLPAVYVCNRCGRAICRDDSKAYLDLVLCPQCYVAVVPPIPTAVPPGAPPPAPPAPPPAAAVPAYPGFPVPAPVPVGPVRALWGFILAIVAGIIIIVNAAALLAPAFYAFWTPIFFWIPIIDGLTTPPPAGSVGILSFALGVVFGLIAIIGSILMILGFGTIGSIVVFPAAILSLLTPGGGFVAGFVLGIVAGILGMLGR